MLDLKVLIFELGTVDRFPTTTVSHGEIATLNHEAWNDSMEDRVDVSEGRVLRNGQFTEVLGSLWNNLTVQPHDDTSEVFIALRKVKVDLVSNFRVSSKNSSDEKCD
jgi:hypothetical protein